MDKRRLIVGISGATGFQYGLKALELLRKLGVESHLVVSHAAELTRSYETGCSVQTLSDLADVVYPIADVGAASPAGRSRPWECWSRRAPCARSPSSP